MHTHQTGKPDVADYIADLSKELAVMARGARMDLLAYLLEMACVEAKARSLHDTADKHALTPPQAAQSGHE